MRITVTAARSVPVPLGQCGRGPQACGVGSLPAPALPSPGWLFQMKCFTGSGDVWSGDANEASLGTEPGKCYLHREICFASAKKIKVKQQELC